MLSEGRQTAASTCVRYALSAGPVCRFGGLGGEGEGCTHRLADAKIKGSLGQLLSKMYLRHPVGLGAVFKLAQCPS